METIAGIKEEIFSTFRNEITSASAPVSSIMIIDDNVEIIAALTTLLRSHYRIISGLNYEEAKKKLTPAVRVVLLDIKMAGKDGTEVFKLLKQERDDLQIIFHSAYPGSSEKAMEVEQLRHGGYLTKGEYKASELLAIIERSIDRSVKDK